MIVRPCRPEDREAIKALIAQDCDVPLDEYLTGYEKHDCAVLEQSGALCGIAYTRRYRADWGVFIYVPPASRGRGLGLKLWEHIKPILLKDPVKITAAYRSDKGHSREFYGALGFRPWYAIETLVYRGERQPAPQLRIHPYNDDLFDTYIRVMGDSFEDMRRANGFEPHNVYDMHNTVEYRAGLQKQSDGVFLGFDEAGNAVGCASVEGDMIDIIGVLPSHRGKGYGTQLTQYCTNHLLHRGMVPRTAVVVTNHKAARIYYGLGFCHVQTEEHATKNLTSES